VKYIHTIVTVSSVQYGLLLRKTQAKAGSFSSIEGCDDL